LDFFPACLAIRETPAGGFARCAGEYFTHYF
jgi:hypothetical protein